MAPLLSICIPTYNRCKLLERTLKDLQRELSGIHERVEICISDNASIDDTRRIVERYAKKLPIRYRRNQKNLGFDRNAIGAWRMGRGKFCWAMGDDDFIVPGAIGRMLDIIESEQYDYVLAEFSFDANPRRDTTSLSDEELAERVLEDRYLITFIGSQVIRRSLLQQIPKKLLDEYDLAYIHFIVFLAARKAGARLLVTRSPFITNGADGSYLTVKSSFVGYLRNAQTLDYAKKRKLITAVEHRSALRSVYDTFFSVALVAAMVSRRTDYVEYRSYFEQNYQTYIKGGANDTARLKLMRMMSSSYPSYVVARAIARLLYKYVYVLLLNPFRQKKRPVVWEFYEQKQHKGAQDVDFTRKGRA